MEEHGDGGEEHRQRQQPRSVAVAAANSASASGEIADSGTDMIITTTPTTTPSTMTMTNLSKFKLFVRTFFLESSSCGLTVLSISILVSLSLSSTAGVVPEVVTDRYARLRYGYDTNTDNDYSDNNNNRHDLDHHACWMYTTDDMPPACTKGADDAQTASAYGSLVMNGVLFVVNSSIGRATDMYGRRIFLILSIFLYTLSPAALLYIQRFPKADPVWYFGARATVGIMDFNTIAFAALSDVIPTVHRAASFAVILGGFYVSYAFGPALAVVLSHQQATFASWVLSIVALVVAILFFPETLHQTSQSLQSVEGHVDNHLVDYVALTETVVEESYPPAPPSSAFLGASCQQQQQQQQKEGEGEGGETPYMDKEQQETSSCDDGNGNESEAGVAVLSNSDNEEDCGGRERKNVLSRFKDLVLKPVRDMSILRRNQTLTLVALGSFLASTVYNVDHTLVLFYVEEHLDVRVHDIAQMLFVLGIVGVIMQCFAFQPLIQCFGEHGLLIVTYISGTVHNFIYGAARKKSAIYSALALSQLTKLNFPILSSLASQEVDESSQGQVQGAMLGLNALAGAFGPLAMNVVYEHTKDGTMFLVSSGLYFTGLLAVIALSRDNKHRCRDEELSSHRQRDDAQHSPRSSSGGIDHESSIEEPLLPQAI
mmetsp:Transcript_39876/g.96242  ORF Transcript_39876/g.96242 Transcript_39876/m.96242 type:complete len:656 (+) Transcript_39876:120-2087(+)